MKSNIANPNGNLNNELFYELIEHTYNNISHFEKQKEFALNASLTHTTSIEVSFLEF